MILTPSYSLRVVLGGAITTNQLDCSADYFDYVQDNTTGKPGCVMIATDNGTEVTLVSAPTQSSIRQINAMRVHNKDTVNATVTVKYDDGATEWIVIKSTLTTGQSLHYERSNGWQVL